MSTKQDHKRWRKQFNESCLIRDGHMCKFCNEIDVLNVHHITNRHDMLNGGYATTNGITVCLDHHKECEDYLNGFSFDQTYCPNNLYEMIGSNYDQAFYDCENLK